MGHVKHHIPKIAVSALLALFGAGWAWGTSLTFSPTGLFLAAPEKAGSLSVFNKDTSAAVRVQVRIFRWRQENGAEKLEPPRDVIASPPVALIPPGEKYTLRLARVAAAAVSAEESYRLVISELPMPIDPATEVHGVRVLINASLPAFFTPPRAAPKLEWRAWSKGGQLHLRASNSGTRHIQLSGLTVEGPKGQTRIEASGSNGYVLPGSTLEYASATGAPDYPAGTPLLITTAKGTPFAVRDQVTVSGP